MAQTCTSRRGVAAILAVAILAGSGIAVGTSQAQVQTYSCAAPGFGPVPVPPGATILLSSLKTVPNPVIPRDPVSGAPRVRDDLVEFVSNLGAAIQLGKALFWDMQAGSDNRTACATCHFRAGADGRTRNQVNPGPNAVWNDFFPNYTLTAGDFPFTVPPVKDIDNIVGSQGIRKSRFQRVGQSGSESTTPVPDPVFNVGGINVRQVTAKNTPSTINAVFNHRNFWNGRAQPEFNGVNPWGNRDRSARVWALGPASTPVAIDIHVQNASLASQAVGPPVNEVEMSAAGRTFPEIGKKMLGAKPLALQKVSPADSVLGPLADTTAGLKTTYASLIRQAFQPKWWNTNKKVKVGTGTYSMMEANFSLFWGISIMLYEATLVADDSPIDRYLDGASNAFPRPPLDASALLPLVQRLQPDFPGLTVDNVVNGLALFELPVAPPPSFPAPPGFGVGCIGCHVGAETTSASVQNVTRPGLEPADVAFKSAGFDLRVERMFMQVPAVPVGTDTITFDPASYTVTITHIDTTANPTPPAVPLQARAAIYDTGWYNVGARPTADDAGLAGQDPFGHSLSWTGLLQAMPDPTFIKIPGNGLGCAGAGNATFPNELLNASGFPLLSGPLLGNEATDVAGSFKTPGLRNVELHGPYFHNGGTATLRQVMQFYDAGGDFRNATLAPAMVPLRLTAEQTVDLVAFMAALTDERVRLEKAPFDHPQLLVPDGTNADGSDRVIEIPAVGAAGGAPVPRFLGMNPFQP